MRIILVGQAAFAEKVLDGLLAQGHDVAAVYCPPDYGARPDPVKARAEALKLPVRQHRSLKGAEVQQEFAAFGADLGVLAYVTQIVPPAVFDTPRLGSICFHPSLLPRYRGGSAINWQIIKGETQAGVSVFWVDAGIDTGPVLLQKTATIGADDTAGSLYYNTLFPLGVAAVLESVQRVAAGQAPRIVQDEALATYDPLCRDEHARVDWSRPAREVYNLVRGCDPQPGAYTLFEGAPLRLYETRPVPVTAQPGVVERISSDGVVIGLRDGGLQIKRIRHGAEKHDAAAFAAARGIGPGTRLG